MKIYNIIIYIFICIYNKRVAKATLYIIYKNITPTTKLCKPNIMQAYLIKGRFIYISMCMYM